MYIGGMKWKYQRGSRQMDGVVRFYSRPLRALCLAHRERLLPAKMDPDCFECRRKNNPGWDPMNQKVLPPRRGELSMAEWKKRQSEREALIAKAHVRIIPQQVSVVVPLTDCAHCRANLRRAAALAPGFTPRVFRCSVCSTRWRRLGKDFERLKG